MDEQRQRQRQHLKNYCHRLSCACTREKRAALFLPQYSLIYTFTMGRGAAAAGAAAFDMGLAKTRLEGLAYATVTTLMLNAALRLFSSTPKKLEPVSGDSKKARVVKFVSEKIICMPSFPLCCDCIETSFHFDLALTSHISFGSFFFTNCNIEQYSEDCIWSMHINLSCPRILHNNHIHTANDIFQNSIRHGIAG